MCLFSVKRNFVPRNTIPILQPLSLFKNQCEKEIVRTKPNTGHSKRDLFVRSSMTIDDNVDRYRAILRYLVQNARFHIPVDGNLSISLNSRIIDL